MRVTLLHSYYASSAPSGENVAVELQAAALRSAGIDTTIVGVSTDDLAKDRFYPVRTALGVATGGGVNPTARLRSTRPDVVHVHNLFPNFSTRWLRRWEGAVVATLHNYRPLCAAGTLARDGTQCTECVGRYVPTPALLHRCYRGSIAATLPIAVGAVGGVNAHPLLRRADHVVFLARRAQSLYADAGYDGLERATVLPNFVQPSPTLPLQSTSREDLPWLYFGRMAPEKGVLRMLRVWPSEVPLHLYGAGPDEIEVARLSGGPVEYRGSLPREELLRILPRHRGLIFPTMFAEGLPTVYLETLAAGLPVLARTGNSAADDVTEHGTGLTFDRFDELPAALQQLDADHEACAASALRRYSEGFSPEAWIDGILDVYQQAISEGERRRGRE